MTLLAVPKGVTVGEEDYRVTIRVVSKLLLTPIQCCVLV